MFRCVDVSMGRWIDISIYVCIYIIYISAVRTAAAERMSVNPLDVYIHNVAPPTDFPALVLQNTARMYVCMSPYRSPRSVRRYPLEIHVAASGSRPSLRRRLRRCSTCVRAVHGGLPVGVQCGALCVCCVCSTYVPWLAYRHLSLSLATGEGPQLRMQTQDLGEANQPSIHA